MTIDDLTESITVLCVEGVEFMTKAELAESILGELKRFEEAEYARMNIYALEVLNKGV